MKSVLEKVNAEKLLSGIKLIIRFEDVVRQRFNHLHNQTLTFDSWARGTKDLALMIDIDGDKHQILIDHLYYPPQPAEQPKEETAVLVELEKLIDFIGSKNLDEYWPLSSIQTHFSKPENQYHPKEQPASPEPMIEAVSGEWTPMVGDEVITNRFETKCNGYSIFVHNMESLIGQKGTVEKIDDEAGGVAKVHAYWWPLSALTLVKKAEKPTETVVEEFLIDSSGNEEKITNCQQTKTDVSFPLKDHKAALPINLARKGYAEGGAAKEIALMFYSEDELKEKQLPISWDELKTIDGYLLDGHCRVVERSAFPMDSDWDKMTYPTEQDAKAALAMAQLLQLRKFWLEMEAPGWVPDWSKQNEVKKWVIRRQDEELLVVTANAYYNPLSFPNQELAVKFSDAFTDLLKTAFCLPQE